MPLCAFLVKVNVYRTIGPLVYFPDKNDHPPEFSENPYQFQATEDSPIGTVVGTILATDKDTLESGNISKY